MISVILPTHNPDPGRLQQTLAALERQQDPGCAWEVVLVDNASTTPLSGPEPAFFRRPDRRVVAEPTLGLTAARLRGFRETTGDLIVLVDDDNVLAPDYLANARVLADTHPEVGVFGGRSLPDYEIPPPPWFDEVRVSLGCRDLGPTPLVVPPPPPGARLQNYPAAGPIGAGMVLRRAVAQIYADDLGRSDRPPITDRRGNSLSSGGDCDIVICALKAGWAIAYDPALVLRHLIPRGRLTFRYLTRLNHDSSQSWVLLLGYHRMSPWSPLHPALAPLLKARAFFRLGAWRAAAYINWRGACGTFDGRVALHR